MFKSYYVVWKPPCDDWPTVREREGLNRTMQYGNQGEIKRRGKIVLSLNRTMQYGNIIYIIMRK